MRAKNRCKRKKKHSRRHRQKTAGEWESLFFIVHTSCAWEAMGRFSVTQYPCPYKAAAVHEVCPVRGNHCKSLRNSKLELHNRFGRGVKHVCERLKRWVTQDLSTVAGMSSVSGTIDIQTQAICLLLIQQIKTRLLLLSTVLYKGCVTKQSRQTKITCKSTRQTTRKPIISPQRHNVYNWESKRVKSSFSPLPVTN